ncbi:unnamed protein product [Arabis nemorensis]|uniref:Uncharacterized protein n=1 Tax=Arabis nemorensis TaxID=586526 RepID=A0A565BDJ9_9BRAS|nr:unnamed protein product [Arabis nemorensis]
MPDRSEIDVFKSTSILGLIYECVKSQTTEKTSPSSEISKLPCFKDERASELHMEKCKQWFDDYKRDMGKAMNADESYKDELASEVIQRYK